MRNIDHEKNKNFGFIGTDIYLKYIDMSFEELEKYVGNKIKTVTFINNNIIHHNNIPLTIPIYLYIIDVHGATNMINTLIATIHLIIKSQIIFIFYLIAFPINVNLTQILK